MLMFNTNFSLSDHIAWAKDPLVKRLPQLQSNLDVRIIYGDDSWISPMLTESEVADYNNISITTIPDASHHVYADQFELFNEILAKLVV